MEIKKLYVKPIMQTTGIIPGENPTFNQLKDMVARWLKKEIPNIPDSFIGDERALISKGAASAESISVKLEGGVTYFAIDFSHACRVTPDRTWHTEIGLAPLPDNQILFGARLTAYTRGQDAPAPQFSTPRIIRQISSDFGLISHDGQTLDGKATYITGRSQEASRAVEQLVDLLENKDRTLPVYVLTAPTNHNDVQSAATNPDLLARETLGLAHVYYLDNPATYELRNMIGQELSVFNGAARTYNRGFNRFTQDLRAHPLILPHTIQRMGGARTYMHFLTRQAYEKSTDNREENERNLPRFAEIRSRYYEEKRLNKTDEPTIKEPTENSVASSAAVLDHNTPTSVTTAPEEPATPEIPDHRGERVSSLESENAQLKALIEEMAKKNETLILNLRESHTQELAAMRTQVDEALGLAASEEQLRKEGTVEILKLQEFVEEIRVAPALSKGVLPPLSLIGEWSDTMLEGRVLITNRARKSAAEVKKHRDAETIYKGVMLLGQEYLTMRRAKNGETGRAKEAFDKRLNEIGLENRLSINPDQAGQYGDTYFVGVDGKKHFLASHLTKGAARDPQSVIRIYFAYDEDFERVIVGHLPTHLQNALT